MNAAPRYAIYFAPQEDTQIWAFGSQVLGYDAASGHDLPGFTLAGIDAESWSAIAAQPRTYGFHGTLKAPFHLNGQSEEALASAIRDFANRRSAFDLGPLQVTAVAAAEAGKGFVALVPKAPPVAIVALEHDIVTCFDRYRRPLGDADRERRRPERLTHRQRSYLEAYGYPFVLEEFRFHMTLTGPIAHAADIADALAERIANDIGTVDLRVGSICLFRQNSSDARFRIIARMPFLS